MSKNLVDNNNFGFTEGVKRSSLYYQPGVEYEETVYTSGYITSGGTVIKFTMPLNKRKPYLDNQGMQLISSKMQAVQNGNYLVGSASSTVDVVNNTSYGVDPDVVWANSYIVFNVSAASFPNATNNSVVGIAFTLKFEFEDYPFPEE